MLNILKSDVQREPMSGVDTAWLRMERPDNLMMITGVMILADRLDVSTLRQLIESHFLSYPRFRQRAIRRSRKAYWEEDTRFDLNWHVRRIGLPGNADRAALQEIASDLMSTPLDYSKPLWQFHLIEDYQGGSALIMRIHHCYADGIALIQVLLSMTDMGTLDTEQTVDEELESGIFARFFRPLSGLMNGALKTGQGLLQQGIGVVRDPGQVVNCARQGAGLASELARLALIPNDPKTCFRGKLGVSKRVAWAQPLPLDEVKTISKALNCSVNDVLLASVAGALGSYLQEQGQTVHDVKIRAAVPVNLRPLEEAKNLGNKFGLVLLSLPLGVANPLERLYQVRDYMQELKGSYQAILTFGLLGVLGLTPDALQGTALGMLSQKATAVMTNVPGPRQSLRLGGARIAEQMFWVPQSGSIGMGVSILSYNGGVQFGLVTDVNLVSDPQVIIDRFAGEFEKLLLITLMETWDEQRDPKEVEASLQAWEVAAQSA